MTKLAKKYNLKITTKYDDVEEKFVVLIAGGNAEKIDHFTQEYQKEFEKQQKQKDKAKEFWEFRKNKKAEREKEQEQERTKNKQEYSQQNDKSKNHKSKNREDTQKDKDIDNDGVVDRVDIDKNKNEVSDIKDLSIKNISKDIKIPEMDR